MQQGLFGGPLADALLAATSGLLAPTAITPAGLTGGPLASAAVVDAGGPSSVLTVASASSAVELRPAQSQAPARVLALTGVDSRSMLMVAWFAIALGALALRLSGPRTIRLRTTGGRRTVR